ncbi:MAG: tail fiber protein [Solirubrobacterales bacterium]|nr:tail fiber protein [Solirubrobacterales bacterium]
MSWQPVGNLRGPPGPEGPPGSVAEVWQAGDLKATTRAAAPAGWLLCQGQEVSGATYPALAAELGTGGGSRYGAAAAGMVKIPDGRDAALLGASGARPLGSHGGVASVALSVAQIPAHNHGGETGTESATHTHPLANSYVGNLAVAGGALGYAPGGVTLFHAPDTGANSAAHTHSIPNQGAGEGHNNMPPYFVGNWMIKT